MPILFILAKDDLQAFKPGTATRKTAEIFHALLESANSAAEKA
jgi:hypothetical protein